MLVGVFAVLSEVYHPATLRPETAQQLIAQLHTLGVGVHSDVDCLLVVEIFLDEIIEVVEVAPRPVGHAYHVMPSGLVETQGIDLPFGDDAFRRPLDGVDIVGNQLGPLAETEGLVAGAVLDVDQLAVAVEVELHCVHPPRRTLLLLRHPFHAVGHPHRLQRLAAYPPASKPGERTLPHRGLRPGLRPAILRFLLAHTRRTIPRLPLHPLPFLIVCVAQRA